MHCDLLYCALSWSCLVLSCAVLSCLIIFLPCLVLCYVVWSCLVSSGFVLCCVVLWSCLAIESVVLWSCLAIESIWPLISFDECYPSITCTSHLVPYRLLCSVLPSSPPKSQSSRDNWSSDTQFCLGFRFYDNVKELIVKKEMKGGIVVKDIYIYI